MKEHLPVVPVVVGPTASGKTALVERLAARCKLFVVSADSRQVYRGLNIGTAKPDPSVLESLPHVGLDLVDPGARFSAGQFARAVPGWLKDGAPDRQAVVVGGTGFYIKAITDGLFVEPELNEGRRTRLQRWARENAELDRWATRLDPKSEVHGWQRAVRVVEVALLSGYPLSWWHQESPGRAIIRPWFVRLQIPREVLHERILARVHEMLDRGLIAEVEELLDKGVAPAASGLDGVGYREVVEFLGGKITRAELPERIARSTRRYAKRQETWFNHQLGEHPILPVDATEDRNLTAERILEAWSERKN